MRGIAWKYGTFFAGGLTVAWGMLWALSFLVHGTAIVPDSGKAYVLAMDGKGVVLMHVPNADERDLVAAYEPTGAFEIPWEEHGFAAEQAKRLGVGRNEQGDGWFFAMPFWLLMLVFASPLIWRVGQIAFFIVRVPRCWECDEDLSEVLHHRLDRCPKCQALLELQDHPRIGFFACVGYMTLVFSLAFVIWVTAFWAVSVRSQVYIGVREAPAEYGIESYQGMLAFAYISPVDRSRSSSVRVESAVASPQTRSLYEMHCQVRGYGFGVGGSPPARDGYPGVVAATMPYWLVLLALGFPALWQIIFMWADFIDIIRKKHQERIRKAVQARESSVEVQASASDTSFTSKPSDAQAE